LAMAIPGVLEPHYSASMPSAPPSATRHTDVYAMLDLFPAFTRLDKDSPAPHILLGLPVLVQREMESRRFR